MATVKTFFYSDNANGNGILNCFGKNISLPIHLHRHIPVLWTNLKKSLKSKIKNIESVSETQAEALSFLNE